jgi:hypothetical protein
MAALGLRFGRNVGTAGWSANKKLATYSGQFRFARQPFGFRVK